MYPVLILRAEFICLVILIFLFYMSHVYNISKESRTFLRILYFAVIHVVFDILTVLTVNNLDSVPEWVNWLCHFFFYISAMLFSNEMLHYVFDICYSRYARKLYAVGHAVIALYICCLPFMKIEYVTAEGTNSSAGIAAVVGYGIACVFFAIALVIIFTHMDRMPTSVKSALIPMMVILIVTAISQAFIKSLLFTGSAITIVTLGLFFSLENPVEVFKKKAMTDALTGVQSRSSYEDDMEKYDRLFAENPGSEYTFVFCDLNDLRSINNRFGHAEGDNYITLIATAIKKCMKHSNSVYRIGGDEFLVCYYKIDEAMAVREIEDLKKECEIISENLEYTAAVSVGYATSSKDYKSLRDVAKTADYAMYQNKSQMKSGGQSESYGIKLNCTGLTDHLFGAMCASNDAMYPFITNMDTNVTRISPAWKDYFGLDSEFYCDFLDMWKDRIHPDYFEGYMDDVVACISGHQKYHHYDYPARRLNGQYVMVSCHGSVYLDSSTGTTYFSGFIVNHDKADFSDKEEADC